MPETVDEVRITTVVDNYVDAMVMESERVGRFDVSQHLARRASPDMTDKLVEAEHGVSMLVEWEKGGEAGTILYDAGWTPEVLLNNLEALEVPLGKLDGVVLSHAHIDHYGGIFTLLERSPVLPVYLRSEGFHPKFVRDEKGEKVAPLNAGFTREQLERGGRVIECGRDGATITPGIRTTGAIPQTTDFEPPVGTSKSGMGFYRNVDGKWESDDPPVDEQGLVINLAGKGLVVLTGCGHTGIINTINRAREQFNGTGVHAVLGGFHTGSQPEAKVHRTLNALEDQKPRCLSPMHCTGHRVINRIGEVFPNAFVLNMVGTRINLSGF